MRAMNLQQRLSETTLHDVRAFASRIVVTSMLAASWQIHALTSRIRDVWDAWIDVAAAWITATGREWGAWNTARDDAWGTPWNLADTNGHPWSDVAFGADVSWISAYWNPILTYLSSLAKIWARVEPLSVEFVVVMMALMLVFWPRPWRVLVTAAGQRMQLDHVNLLLGIDRIARLVFIKRSYESQVRAIHAEEYPKIAEAFDAGDYCTGLNACGAMIAALGRALWWSWCLTVRFTAERLWRWASGAGE
jgi:hypothetical protein